MAKDKITDYSATAASNTDVGGVGIVGNVNVISNLDNAIREMMTHLAETNAGTYPVDDTWTYCDPSDRTKKFRFDGGSITAGNTRVITMPDGNVTIPSGTLVTEAGAQTLTNKTLTAPTADTLTLTAGIELGHATDTTLSRGAAGFMAVEGKRVPSPASQAAGDVLYRGSTEWERLAKGTALQALLMNAGATAPAWTTIPFTQSYESSQQTITSGGALTLAHGLGSKPKFYRAYLQCTTAELGYSIGDETVDNEGNNRGVSLVPDATNINVRFGSSGTALQVLDKSTGATSGITNSSWRLVVRAWA